MESEGEDPHRSKDINIATEYAGQIGRSDAHDKGSGTRRPECNTPHHGGNSSPGPSIWLRGRVE